MNHNGVRILVLLGLIASLGVSATSSAQGTPRRSITPITGDLYRGQNNNHFTVFLVTDEGIILTDPINTGFATWLKSELDSRFDVPVRYVLYSHHHGDHASGGDVFADTAKFVGHENMLSHLAMPPESTPLPIEGQYALAATMDANGNGKLEYRGGDNLFEAGYNNVMVFEKVTAGPHEGPEDFSKLMVECNGPLPGTKESRSMDVAVKVFPK